MAPEIDAAADHLPGDGQGDGERDHLPADVVGDAQADDKGHGKVDVDEPAHGILGRALAQVAERDVAQCGEGEQAGQGDVDFDAQEKAFPGW